MAHNLWVDVGSLRGAHRWRTMGARAASFEEDQLLSSKNKSEEGYYWNTRRCDAQLEAQQPKNLAASAACISLFLAPWRRMEVGSRLSSGRGARMHSPVLCCPCFLVHEPSTEGSILSKQLNEHRLILIMAALRTRHRESSAFMLRLQNACFPLQNTNRDVVA
jgi:hypothetical protein